MDGVRIHSLATALGGVEVLRKGDLFTTRAYDFNGDVVEQSTTRSEVIALVRAARLADAYNKRFAEWLESSGIVPPKEVKNDAEVHDMPGGKEAQFARLRRSA